MGLRIGLIGGIGVAATILYYQRLTKLVTAQGATLSLCIEHGDIQTLIRNNRADDRQAQADEYAVMIARLAGAGCDCVAITSLGGHFCFAETAARASLPLVSGVAPLDDAFVEQGVRRVGVLGVRGVMRSRLYGQLRRTEAVALDEEIEVLGQAYQDMAVAGVCTPAQRALFIDAGYRLVREHDADAVVLAGTDLNLAFDDMLPGYRVIDAVDIHVAALADLATGRRTLESLTAGG